MLNLDEKYKVGKKFPMKDFISKDLKPAVREKIKEYVKSCVLAYQIVGDEIPSVITDEYNVQVVQFYDFELDDIKHAKYIANIYQTEIKALCVIRFFDCNKEIYSFALKRLNQNDTTKVVVTDSILTSEYTINLPSSKRKEFVSYVGIDNIVNKQNKVLLYREMYVKTYILTNKVFANAKDFLNKKEIWYSENKVNEIYSKLIELEQLKNKVAKASNNAEKIAINNEIAEVISTLKEI